MPRRELVIATHPTTEQALSTALRGTREVGSNPRELPTGTLLAVGDRPVRPLGPNRAYPRAAKIKMSAYNRKSPTGIGRSK